MTPKLLIYAPQSPFDPSSGAAQSTRIIGECLASAGYSVRWIGTTACENTNLRPEDHLPESCQRSSRGVLDFVNLGVHYTLLELDQNDSGSWEEKILAKLSEPLQNDIAQHCPQLYLSYGDNLSDQTFRRFASQAGAHVVFALHNSSYKKREIHHVDRFLTPTSYLKKYYTNSFSKPIVALPPPIDQERVANRPFRPTTISFINPEPAKGSILVAQLIKRFDLTHPETPFLVVGGRVPAEAILKTGEDAGIDLSHCSNLYAIPPLTDVGEVFSETKILLMPSVVKEAAGRCAIEAMLNGSVALVSNQGGLSEIGGDAAIQLPAPPPTPYRAKPVPASIVEAWARQICKLLDDDSFYRSASARCRSHAVNFRSEALAPLYRSTFDSWWGAT